MDLREKLLEFTESYLCSLMSDVSNLTITTNDLSTPFLELGIDSFRVLQIIKKLEEEFGTLPKTLLFENFNIGDLSKYFVKHYETQLTTKFGGNQTSSTLKVTPEIKAVQPVIAAPVESSRKENVVINSQKVSAKPQPKRIKRPILVLERELPSHPELHAWYETIFNKYKNEGSASRGTRNIAPFLFIGSDRKGYLNFGKSGNIVLVYACTGPRSYFTEIAEEIAQYCIDNHFELTMLSDYAIESIGNEAYYATPFGIISRIINIKEFTTQGSKMRRLRYQVSKFEKSGESKTVEYTNGTDKKTDKKIADLIDAWCAPRTMVNPLIHIVKDEILKGKLSSEHRLFLTYLNDELQNAILISALSSEMNGYLMDLEFYPDTMPLGGLEYGIVKMMEILASEGADILSLGGTYGCKLENSKNADPELDKTLTFLRENNIFNDEGNLQFKNKFRPEHQTIFICRPKAISNPDNVTDVIMMVADPSKMEADIANESVYAELVLELPSTSFQNDIEVETSIDAKPKELNTVASIKDKKIILEGEERSIFLAKADFNPLNIVNNQVDYDLKTDSWAQLENAEITSYINFLQTKLYQPIEVEKSVESVFPFKYHTLTTSGRDAEKALFKSWKQKGNVVQNILFPTPIFSEIENGFSPIEVPHQEIYNLNSNEVFKGNLNWEIFTETVEKKHESIAFVAVELSNNGAGGAPISLNHLKKVKSYLTAYKIPLLIDGTRVLENASSIKKYESDYAQKSIWEITNLIFSQADAIWVSLAKDFCVNTGGLVATNDAELYSKIKEVIEEEGIGIDILDKKLIAHSLDNKNALERKITERMSAVESIQKELLAQGIPVVKATSSHCILIDVKQLPEFQKFEYPVASFIAWLYLSAGIRAGAHSVGMQKNTAINNLVRLAIPVGLESKKATQIATVLKNAFEHITNVPELILQNATEVLGNINTPYAVKAYHNVTTNLVEVSLGNAKEGVQKEPNMALDIKLSKQTTVSEENNSVKVEGHRTIKDIAIVGMSGRYPKAKNLKELWKNLLEGKDCIETIPEERLQQRKTTQYSKKYRGGFLSDVDKFDSMFFNISPVVAEMFDPQERLLLETAWESIEDAGYYPEILTPEGTPKDIGVFVGAVWTMYQMIGAEEKLVGHDTNPNSFLWSVANRISYCLNLSGPSLSVDTACSSSMTALYLACEAIYNGECSGAIVGGVNLDLHQSKFDINSFGGALSPDGVCRTFGKGANGYVAGEGVGAIFIKPLEQAIKDGDHIHGVIKGVSVNHGGRTSGYMVPDPKAQANLVVTALEKANINAKSIGYIEAHGTGTELGDPIEISGLTNAFKNYDVENQTCAIGSVKTNIGHLEAAAGIVGIQKVLLQMKHKTLVASLHSSELNEFIDFENSPFYVEQQVEEWIPKTIDGVQYPLRAGISSFGAGGANAHVILESYTANMNLETVEGNTYQIFPFSAVKEERLYEVAKRFYEFLEYDSQQTKENQLRLEDIGHTLRIGRKSFEHRLVIVANTKTTLKEKLKSFIEKKKDTSIIHGVVERGGNIVRLLNTSEKKAFVDLIANGDDLIKLGQLWIEGIMNDWQDVSIFSKGKRVPLPTYPFADKRHWVERKEDGTVLTVSQVGHPLIDANESTFERQLFRKTFHNQDFFIYDHLVSDIPTLPGVAYLDFARKAGELAAGRKVKSIKNIIWVNPITVTNSESVDVWIELIPQDSQVKFEVFSKNEAGAKQLHSQGRIAYETQDYELQDAYIDINAIKNRCSKVAEGAKAYPEFKKLGLGLGPSFQVLQEVYKNEDEMFGVMKVPEACQHSFKDFLLHPSLLDGAGQTVMAAHLLSATEESEGLFVPYSFGEVEIYHPLTENCYSYIQKVNEPGSKLSKANLTIADEEGKILVRILESVGIPLTEVHEKPTEDVAPKASTADKEEEAFSKLYYTHVWETKPTVSTHTLKENEVLLLFDTNEQVFEAFQKTKEVTNKRCILVKPGKTFGKLASNIFEVNPLHKDDFKLLFEELPQQNITSITTFYAWSKATFAAEETFVKEALNIGVNAFLYVCQSLAHLKIEAPMQLLYAFEGKRGEVQPHNEAMNGFAKSLHLEHSNILCKTIEIESNHWKGTDVLEIILKELHEETKEETTIRYEEGQRYVRQLRNIIPWEKAAKQKEDTVALKEKGVYIITGGAGGLGFIFAEYLAKKCKARLVLTGRSELSKDKETKIAELETLGSEVLYLKTDVSKKEEVATLITETKARFKGINGIIHSAGVLRDAMIRNKSIQEIQEVFEPKVWGVLNLDEATQKESLDFFVTFSSMAAVGGNMGQCDYSYANHFMDTFIQRRTFLKEKGERFGKSLSLNWSIWADGGMKLDTQMEQFFKNSLGIRPLAIATGVEAFTKGLLSSETQMVVVEGMQERMEIAWGIRKKQEAPQKDSEPQESIAIPTNENTGEAAMLVQQELVQIVMSFLKLEEEDVAINKILLDIGFDSIGLASFADALNEKYALDVITPVLFFEYPSISEITKYLVSEHQEAVIKAHGLGGTVVQKEATTPTKTPTKELVQKETTSNSTGINKGWNPKGLQGKAEKNTTEKSGISAASRFTDCPIAIVGIGGVMPKSKDMEAYWENLRNEENMISVIPRDRWIWEDYDGDPITEKNKTNSKYGGFIEDADKFDPLFFGISPREAEMMDPQQRVFLETVWSTIEDSGYKVSDLSGTKTGLFVGVAVHDYSDLMNGLNVELDGYTASGNSHCMLANRISFLLNLRGPSAPIDTACSSSLIAIHRAIESIHTGSSDMAIVGGVQLMMTPAAHISFGMAGMLSSDGKCKTFDKNANGYVRGEGSGAIFLKPLAQAEADNDQIYAVIKSTAENHGGRATMLTAPNPHAQSELLVEAYEKAQVDPATVGYIECHGTGTSLGDPIEIRALAKSFKELYDKNNKAIPQTPHIGLSSVKTNIGHLETAAGISSFLKAVLAMKHKQIPASLHFEELNPHINLSGTPFYVVDKTTHWEAFVDEQGKPIPRRAGISSFGFGGANAHVVIEEYIPSKKVEIATPEPCVFVLSAKNEERLKVYAQEMLQHVERHDINLANFTYTLQVGRDAMNERIAFIVNSTEDIKEQLTGYLEGAAENTVYRGNSKQKKSGDPQKHMLGDWIATKNYEELLQAWVSGSEVQWELLYGETKPQRIHIPTYPFAREHYWFDFDPNNSRDLKHEIIHPLIHQNTSTLRQQSYTSYFAGNELFVRERETAKEMSLGGFLEMARAAITNATSVRKKFAPMELTKVSWHDSLEVNKDREVMVSLFEEGDEIKFEVASAKQGEEAIHVEGSAKLHEKNKKTSVNLEQLKKQLRFEEGKHNGVFDAFKERGLNGYAYPKISTACQGHKQLLVKVSLPEEQLNEVTAYGIHPSMVEVAIDTCGLLMNFTEQSLQPNTLGCLKLNIPCNDEMYVWVRQSRITDLEEGKIVFDIDFLNEEGEVCLTLKSLVFHVEIDKNVSEFILDNYEEFLESFFDLSSKDSLVQIDDEFKQLLEEDFSNKN